MSAILTYTKLKKTEQQLWLYTFIAQCFIFSPLLFHLIWGNHDWLPLLLDSKWSSGLIEGRFSQYILLCLLLMGKILPILNILLGLLLYALALTLLYTRFFNWPINKFTFFAVITAASLPYINEILYFQFIVFSQLSWPLFTVLALLCAKKASSQHFYMYTFLAYILLTVIIGGYPACINLFVTAGILELIKNATTFKNWIKKSIPYGLSVLFAFATLYIIHKWLSSNHFMLNLYNNHTPNINELIAKIVPTTISALKSMLQIQPFFPLNFKLTTSALSLLYAICKIKQASNFNQKILTAVNLLILLLCLKFSAWLTTETPDNYFAHYDPAAFMVRTDFYAIPCLILYCLTELAQSSIKALKNISFALCCVLFSINIKSDLNFSKVHLFGFKSEALLQERINERIQENPHYNPQKLYTIVQAGELPARTHFYQKSPLEKYGYYMLQVPYTRHWIAFEYYNFYAPKNFVKEGTSINPEQITPQMIDFLSYKMGVWPSDKALYVDDNYAIIALTKQGKTTISEQFQSIKDTFR